MKVSESQTQLEGIIKLCKTASEGALDPFAVDTEYVLSIIRKYYPIVKSLNELCLDATALKELSSVIEKQNDWIQHQSTTLYKDPFLISQNLMMMDIRAISESFLKSWHPIVEFEQISSNTIGKSLIYWSDLLPISERWVETDLQQSEMMVATRSEAFKLGILSNEIFSNILEKSWLELKKKVGRKTQINYWDWINSESYEETIERAYLTSYLVSYGYASIEIDRFNENIFLTPIKEPSNRSESDKNSVLISIDFEEWLKWQKE